MTVTASKYETKANWFYETEAWATKALLRHVPVRGLVVWEPAAGNHKIADVLAAMSYQQLDTQPRYLAGSEA